MNISSQNMEFIEVLNISTFKIYRMPHESQPKINVNFFISAGIMDRFN